MLVENSLKGKIPAASNDHSDEGLKKEVHQKQILATALQRKLKQANQRIEDLEKDCDEQKKINAMQRTKFDEQIEEYLTTIDEQESQLTKLKEQLIKA